MGPVGSRLPGEEGAVKPSLPTHVGFVHRSDPQPAPQAVDDAQ